MLPSHAACADLGHFDSQKVYVNITTNTSAAHGYHLVRFFSLFFAFSNPGTLPGVPSDMRAPRPISADLVRYKETNYIDTN